MNAIIIDLDNTLINIDSYKKELYSRISLETNLSFSQVRETHVNNLNKTFEELFSHKSAKITDIIDSSLKKIEFYSPVVNYVRSFSGKKYLLTLGNKEHQLKKTEHLKLDEFFDEIWITENNKLECLKNKIFFLSKFKEITIIDDDISFLKKVKIEYPNYKAIDVQLLKDKQERTA